MSQPTITLITGADKGIGFATAQALAKAGQSVLIGARHPEAGQNAVAKIQADGGTATFIQLDVTDQAQIDAAAATIAADYGYLSILINNAGVALDHHAPASTMSTAVMRQDFDVNFFGLVAVTQAMIPLLKKADDAQIINLSSNMGSLGLASDPQSRFYQVNSLGYQASKAAVNFATICFGKELAAANIPVNSVNPGWTATAFGGRDPSQPAPKGMQSIQTGAAHVVELALTAKPASMTFTENAGALPW